MLHALVSCVPTATEPSKLRSHTPVKLQPLDCVEIAVLPAPVTSTAA